MLAIKESEDKTASLPVRLSSPPKMSRWVGKSLVIGAGIACANILCHNPKQPAVRQEIEICQCSNAAHTKIAESVRYHAKPMLCRLVLLRAKSFAQSSPPDVATKD